MIDDTNIKTAADLAQDALDSVDGEEIESALDKIKVGDELSASDDLADTLSSLQSVIERNALQLNKLREDMKEKRDSLKSVYENDAGLATAEEEAKVVSQQVKEKRSALKSSPQVTSLSTQIAELREQMKEIEETLNNHLLNYFSLTNSTSFDTSEGDQWDFNVRAKLKAKAK